MKNVRNHAQAKSLGPMKVLGDNLVHQVAYPTVGRMLFFTYSPKFKEKLPYYDTFPLVVPMSVTPTHFTGINFHYIHPKIRLILLNTLKNYVDDDTLSPRAKLQYSWQLLQRAGKTRQASGAVKMYLASHVRSRFVDVPPVDWVQAIFLPVERFQGASNLKVWFDTLGTE